MRLVDTRGRTRSPAGAPQRGGGVAVCVQRPDERPRGVLVTDINGFSVSLDRSAIGITAYRLPGTEATLPVRAEVAALLMRKRGTFSAHQTRTCAQIAQSHGRRWGGSDQHRRDRLEHVMMLATSAGSASLTGP